MLAMTAGMAGIRTTAMYLTAEELGKKRPQNVTWVLSGCFVYSILCSGIISLGLYIFAPQLAQHWIGDIRTVGAIRLYAGFVPMCCLCGVMTGYFTAANRIGTLAAVEVAEQILYMTVTMVVLTFWAGTDPAKACQCVVFGSGVSCCMTLLCLVILRIREKPTVGKRIPISRRLLGVAMPLALADDVKAGISTTENLMVPKRLALFPGAENPLAAFGMVCGMVFPVLMFPAAIVFGLAELLIPELARCTAAGSKRRVQYLVQRSLRVTLLYGCLCAGIEFLLAKEICAALYKNNTAGAFLQLYALLIPMLYCDAITDAMTKGLGQQKACVRYNILTSAMDVGLLFILLPKYGMYGYFVSFLITHLINFILSLRRLIKITGQVMQLRTSILMILCTILSAGTASFTGNAVLRCLFFLCLMPCLLFFCKALDKKDVLWLKGLICGHKNSNFIS